MKPLYMMLGALGLGGAAYLALKKPAEAAAKKPDVAPPPSPTPISPTPPVPVTPYSPPITPEAALNFVNSLTSLHLKQDQYHRGRMLLQDFFPPPVNTLSTREEITKGLAGAGWKDIRVFMNVSELPMNADFPGGPWPISTAQNTVAGTRWFQAQWSGPTMDTFKPPHIEAVWVTQSPGLYPPATIASYEPKVSGVRMTG